MELEYAQHGVRFRFPADWELSEQRDGRQVSITVSSPHTSYWMVTLLSDRPDPNDAIAAVLEAFAEEYEELDVYPVHARIGRRSTVARDIDFVCLELLNVARVRAFRTREFTVVVLYQGTDGELVETGPLLEQMTSSLSVAATAEADDDPHQDAEDDPE